MKKPSKKKVAGKIGDDQDWVIKHGKLTRPKGRPGKVRSLFSMVGEKIPFSFLGKVKDHIGASGVGTQGVYIAHDSMGYPRYVGRGDVFARLKARQKAQILELSYFSFFIVENKIHEREVETIMIRASGPLLDFNARKVRTDISAADIKDFEPGTQFVERQYRKGPRKKKSK